MLILVARILSSPWSICAVLMAGMLLLYEGVPVLNDIPYVDRIPGIGNLVVGRVGRARLQGAVQERVVWQERTRRAEAKQRVQRQKTQAELDAIEREYLRSQALLTALQTSKEGITDADYLCSGPAISERLSDRIDRAGN